ncbi:hypothetical protein Q7Y12_11730, partial [Glaesserella parasuis]|nr:hypothetical protein [Glaesserella parasuis]MDP0479560.1 hypothetical protein [Glaesserella parasuis]
GFNPPIKSICYGYMVGQDPPYKLLPPQVGESQKHLPPLHCKKKKKKQELHKTKDKITRIFQRLSIKVRNNRRKSNESGD